MNSWFNFHFGRLLPGVGLFLAVAAGCVSAFAEAGETRAPRESRCETRSFLLKRAQRYLDTTRSARAPGIAARITLVRGLLQAGIEPEHPLIRKQLAELAAWKPRNEKEAAPLRALNRLALLAARAKNSGLSFVPGKEEGRRLRCELLAYHETYRGWGSIRLAKPCQPVPAPVPLPVFPESGAVLASGGTLPTVLRKVDFLTELLATRGPSLDRFRISDHSYLGDVASAPGGYVQIVLLDRQRK